MSHHQSSSLTILPTLLYSDLQEMQAKATEYQQYVDQVHVDFADGKFVPNTLPDIEQVKTLQTTLKFEAHLMVEQPATMVEQALQDPRFATIILHVESQGDLLQLLFNIRQAGRRAGLALKPDTPLSAIDPYFDKFDQLLIMTVHPGFNGSPFIPAMLDKVRQASQQFPHIHLECDGGVSVQTIGQIKQAGAKRVAAGSFFHQNALQDGLAQLQQAIDSPPDPS